MELQTIIVWSVLIVGGLIAAVIHYTKLTDSLGKEYKKEMEAKKRPLTKVELARKRAANKAAENKGKKGKKK